MIQLFIIYNSNEVKSLSMIIKLAIQTFNNEMMLDARGI